MIHVQSKGYRIIGSDIKLVTPSRFSNYDGMKLDHLVLMPITLSSQKDVSDLIDFLRVAKYSFENPTKTP